MKTMNAIFKMLSIICLAFLVNLTTVNAQQKQDIAETNKAVSSNDLKGGELCEDLIFETRSKMQVNANKTCRTGKKTITCTDKRTGMVVYVTLIVQPEIEGCESTSIKVEDKASEAVSRGASSYTFSVDVLQDHCDRGGVTLSAYVPGNDLPEKKKRFDYEWYSEGEVFDKDNLAECVTNDKITLKVTHIETGQTVIKSITLEAPPSPGSKDYKMFGYEKTPCYGTCPTFKVALHKDGKAIWTGIRNVERQGQWVATISQEQLRAIKAEAQKANYFDLAANYPIEGQVADASRTITYVRLGDTEKTVTHTLGGPQNLVKFENILYKVISSLEWRAND